MNYKIDMVDFRNMNALIDESFGFTADSMPEPFNVGYGTQWFVPVLDMLGDQMYSSVRDGILIGSGD